MRKCRTPTGARASAHHEIRSAGSVESRGARGEELAEGVGFEPTVAFTTLVFKTSTFVRSVIPPGITVR